MNILAIDLGKFNSMCCFFDTDTQEHRFQMAATTKHYLTAVLTNHKIDLVVMEACGPSGWLSDLCQEHKIKTLVCSTNEEAWRWKSTKRKTDNKLARLAMMRQLKPVHVPTRQMREYRTMVKYRKTLDQRINRIKNSVRSLLFANRGIEIDRGRRAWGAGREFIDARRKPFADCVDGGEKRSAPAGALRFSPPSTLTGNTEAEHTANAANLLVNVFAAPTHLNHAFPDRL